MSVAAQPTLQRAKTSKAVVEYVHYQIFEGRLRSGDRVNVEAISAALGVSPTPVREALVLLQREGVITTQWHRAAFVEQFDARTLRADFHVLGTLSGVAVARVAMDQDPEVISRLHELLDQLRASPTDDNVRRWELSAHILRVQHRAGATPRLLAELRGFGGFLEWAARQSDQRTHEQIVEAQARVLAAIDAGHEREASQARIADARAAAEEVITGLIQRGVLNEDGTAVVAD